MNKQQVVILNRERIERKLRRMAYQIWEHHSDKKELIFVGIEHGGLAVAKSLVRILEEISDLHIRLVPYQIDKENPLPGLRPVNEDLNGKYVVLVDDVANSGKTLLYALRPLLDYTPEGIMIAVLLDRSHKAFPISPDIVGHTVSTTLREHIRVEHQEGEILAAYLI